MSNNSSAKPSLNYELEVKQTINDLGITLDTATVFEWRDGSNGTYKIDHMVAEIMLYRNRNNLPAISKEMVAMVVATIENREKVTALKDIAEKIKYNPNAPDLFEALARQISDDLYEPMYPTILRHIVWTLKRRLNNLPDYCPIFTSFYGAAGCGKSEFLKSMFSIFPPAVRSRVSNAAELFNDERQSFRFAENVVIIMDELSGVSKADLNKLKNQIDAEKIVYRVLGFNKTAEGKNRALLVGTSNTRLRNTILSDTDIRKWAEIDFYSYHDNEVPEKMVKPLQQFSWLDLWQSVNENGDSPFHDADTYNKFKSWTSAKCQHESPHLLYLQSVIDRYEGKWLSKSAIYDNGYLVEVTEHHLNWGNFKEKAEKFGFKSHKRDIGIGLIVPSASTPSVLAKDGEEF